MFKMKGRTVTFLFLNIVAAVFLYPVTENGHTIGKNCVDEALLAMGITGSTVNWELAFARLAERYGRLQERYEDKSKALKQLLVLNFICLHLETLLLIDDPIYYTSTNDDPLTTMNTHDVGDYEVPYSFRGSLEADFKTAFVRWYRVLMNSKNPDIVSFIASVKMNLSDRVKTEREIAKILAVIWCSFCMPNGIHSVLYAAKGQVVWNNADEVADDFKAFQEDGLYVNVVHEVADAFKAFQEDGLYVNVVRILFKMTKFREVDPMGVAGPSE